MTTYAINAIDPIVVKHLLIRDDAGQIPWLSVDPDGGAPMRCCLRFSEPGDRIALAAYQPLRRWAEATGADPGPYDERGPVFVHADACPGPSQDIYPLPRHRVFRAYGGDGRILGGRHVPADHVPAEVLDEMFADPDVALVHVRAVEFGCFLYQATRTA